MPCKLGFSDIVTEGIDIVSLVSAWPFPEPDRAFVVGENIIPFAVIWILVEFILYINRIIL